jgi:hypothetical protein
MHYGDILQIDKAILIIVVYNHEILGCKESSKFKKDGSFSKKYVDYQITSIKKVKFINPRSLKLLLNEPYKILNKEFSKRKLDPSTSEGFYQVQLYTTDGYDLKISSINNVTYDVDPFSQLH